MSDLDTELRGLRDELTAALPLPDVERLSARARGRRRLQVVAIVAAVAAVAAAMPLVRAGRPATPATTHEERMNTSYVMDFADPDHGYALGRTCLPASSGCTFLLHRTADGGRTWASRTLPPALDTKAGYYSAVLYVLGPDAVAIGWSDGTEPSRIHSTDGGRTWRRDDHPRQGGGAAPLDRGALLTARCAEQPFITAQQCSDLGTIRPDTGEFVATPAQPPRTPLQIGPTATRGGRYWAICVTAGAYAIAISADGGRTWSVSTLADDSWTRPNTWSVVEGDGVLYATNESDVWSSTDGGKSWTHASSSTSALPTAPAVGSPMAAGDGSLLVSDGTNTWRSADQGRTFVETLKEPLAVTWTRGGYLRLRVDRFALSDDGLSWREFSVR